MIENRTISRNQLLYPELYGSRMNLGMSQKDTDIIPEIVRYIRSPNPIILSAGAGTGKLEAHIAGLIPDSTVIGLDISLKMIETIDNEAKIVNGAQNSGKLYPLRADATNIPIRNNSADVIIAPSIIHEIVSYIDGYRIGPATIRFFKSAAEILKPGGLLIIRDFMLIGDPDSKINIRIGNRQDPSDTVPASFVKKFAHKFSARDLSYISAQLKYLKRVKQNTIHTNLADAMETAIHYSWSKRFDSEVQETYFPISFRSYPEFVLNCFQEAGVRGEFLKSNIYLQSGYPEHINGRIDLINPKTRQRIQIPAFNGVVVFRKISG
jgi:SAM-dependent methyltransferase